MEPVLVKDVCVLKVVEVESLIVPQAALLTVVSLREDFITLWVQTVVAELFVTDVVLADGVLNPTAEISTALVDTVV